MDTWIVCVISIRGFALGSSYIRPFLSPFSPHPLGRVWEPKLVAYILTAAKRSSCSWTDHSAVAWIGIMLTRKSPLALWWRLPRWLLTQARWDCKSLNPGGVDPEVRHIARLGICEMMAQGIPYYLLATAALTCFGSGIDAQQGGYVLGIAMFGMVFTRILSRC